MCISCVGLQRVTRVEGDLGDTLQDWGQGGLEHVVIKYFAVKGTYEILFEVAVLNRSGL